MTHLLHCYLLCLGLVFDAVEVFQLALGAGLGAVERDGCFYFGLGFLGRCYLFCYCDRRFRGKRGVCGLFLSWLLDWCVVSDLGHGFLLKDRFLLASGYGSFFSKGICHLPHKVGLTEQTDNVLRTRICRAYMNARARKAFNSAAKSVGI